MFHISILFFFKMVVQDFCGAFQTLTPEELSSWLAQTRASACLSVQWKCSYLFSGNVSLVFKSETFSSFYILSHITIY